VLHIASLEQAGALERPAAAQAVLDLQEAIRALGQGAVSLVSPQSVAVSRRAAGPSA
jgi:hypothetical protein